MQKRALLTFLTLSVIASMVVVSAIAVSDNVYTWEKTFDVGKPEILGEITVSDHRLVGCPVKVWVHLMLNDSCGDCWHRYEWNEEWNDDCEDGWGEEWKDDCEDEWKEEMAERWRFRCHPDVMPIPIRDCGCQINGTYSAHLYWWNQTVEDWQHLMHLQEATNVTLTCGRLWRMHVFTPTMEGEYKVVVHFTVDAELYTFTNEM